MLPLAVNHCIIKLIKNPIVHLFCHIQYSKNVLLALVMHASSDDHMTIWSFIH